MFTHVDLIYFLCNSIFLSIKLSLSHRLCHSCIDDIRFKTTELNNKMELYNRATNLSTLFFISLKNFFWNENSRKITIVCMKSYCKHSKSSRAYMFFFIIILFYQMKNIKHTRRRLENARSRGNVLRQPPVLPFFI